MIYDLQHVLCLEPISWRLCGMSRIKGSLWWGPLSRRLIRDIQTRDDTVRSNPIYVA